MTKKHWFRNLSTRFASWHMQPMRLERVASIYNALGLFKDTAIDKDNKKNTFK